MQKKFKEKIARIAFANFAQDVMCLVIEECSELIKSITKLYRGIGTMNEVVEEIADVLIVIEELKERCGITDLDVEIEINKKIKRTYERLGIEDEKTETKRVFKRIRQC